MKRIQEAIEEVLFFAAGILLVLGMCAIYWICRLFGIDLNDDF